MMIERRACGGWALYSCLVSFCVFLIGVPMPPAAVGASGFLDLSSSGGVGKIRVPVDKSRVLRLGQPVTRVSVGNPNIADILVLEARQLYVLGKSLGATNVVIWGEGDKVLRAIDIEVTHDLEALKAALHQLMPNERISVRSVQGNIALSGQVARAASVQAAVDIAEGFLPRAAQSAPGGGAQMQLGGGAGGMPVSLPGGGAPQGPEGKVINLLQVGGSQQVMLKVQVAEISRSFTKKLDINFTAFGPSGGWRIGAVNGGASTPDALLDVPRTVDAFGNPTDFVQRRVPLFDGGGALGPYIQEFAPDAFNIEDKGLYLSYLGGDFLFRMALEAAKNKGLAKVLAEPTLTVLSGQEATFLSGGEFPVPVSKGVNEGISVEYKEFGIGLKFVPVVLGSGQISLKVNVSVSDLSNANAAVVNVPTTSSSFFIPALTKRSAVSTVELGNGQTMGIAGLINESLREQVNRFPGLADVPVLGMLFRSQEFEKGQTELVIFVTPYFAKGTERQNLTMPTDAFVEPSDAEFYLMGRTIGDPALQRRLREGFFGGGNRGGSSSGGTEGLFGHDL
jgi:pilus assembly protein CpaC